ncbi:hypothetical protein Ciccas_005150 [Cichlidogyrus casuarinus]|uniref:Uncharacterized protein n=1 Tax=Cichlidogyrus casuarinus TaxID=1844966 RepID=A0ABD2Q9J3_9PLAT
MKDVTSLGTTVTKFSNAFLGVPFHLCYKSREDIPKDFLEKLSDLTDLDLDRYFFLCEKALKFVLAREIVKLNDITCQFLQSTISTFLLTASVYISYLYTDNMIPKLRMLGFVPSLALASLTFFGIILLQQQLLQTLLRKNALRVDQLVVSTNPDYIEYGKEYYKWRINFNKLATFVEERQRDQSNKSVQTVTPTESNMEFKLIFYFIANEYFLPEHFHESPVNLNKNTLYWRYTPLGNEIYAADGNMCGLGLGSLLALGAFGFNNPFTSLMKLLYNPASSYQRLNALNKIKVV